MRLRSAIALGLACGALAAPAPAQAGLFDFLFGPSHGRSTPIPQRSFSLEPAPAARPAPHVGGASRGRSVCVRLCDGYYYPLESVATRGGSSLSDCEASCPGVAMGVFRAPGGDAMDDARDSSGRRYGDLDAAFSYRKALTPGCACQRSAGGASVMGDMTLRAGDIVVTAEGAMVFRGKATGEAPRANEFESVRSAGAIPKGAFAQVDRVLGFSFQEAQARQGAVQAATRSAEDDIVVTPLRTGTITGTVRAEGKPPATPARPGGPRVVLPLPSGR